MRLLAALLFTLALVLPAQAQNSFIGGTQQNISATTAVVATGQRVRLVGFYVNSTSSGVIVFRTGGASGTVLSGSITPAIGWHFFPAEVGDGLHVTLVSGSINITLIYQ